MNRWMISVGASVAVLIFAAGLLVWNGLGAARTPEEVASRELDLVHGRCTGSESIDRWLLQQTWFYDQAFHKLAGGFGQSSFDWYKEGDTTQIPLEGAFCVSGNSLMVTYYERQFVPVMFWPSRLTIEFGTKLKPLGRDTYAVKELNEHRMVLSFESDPREHVYYRKN